MRLNPCQTLASQANNPKSGFGLGLMIGVELKSKVQKPLQALQEKHGVCALLAGPTVMRFLPPLIITREDIDLVVEAVRAVLAE